MTATTGLFETFRTVRTLTTALADLAQDQPFGETVDGADLVLVRRGEDLVCGVHEWDFQARYGISAYDSSQRIHRFASPGA